ncbi:hypothetical protein WG66_000200 [Moniliophthora roreri]|nr:hypothetical protein WG66_000200 [Moniliophthora roreri]
MPLSPFPPCAPFSTFILGDQPTLYLLIFHSLPVFCVSRTLFSSTWARRPGTSRAATAFPGLSSSLPYCFRRAQEYRKCYVHCADLRGYTNDKP